MKLTGLWICNQDASDESRNRGVAERKGGCQNYETKYAFSEHYRHHYYQ